MRRFRKQHRIGAQRKHVGGRRGPPQGFPLVTPYEANGAGSDFVSELSPDVSQLLFSSYSDGANLAADPSGAIYVSGTSPYSGGLHKNSAL